MIVRELARELVEAGLPVTALRIFGSRARAHSSAGSDLDIAVELDAGRDRDIERRVRELAEGLSIPNDESGFGLRVQLIPFFRGEDALYLARAILPDAETVWTRT